MTTAVQTQHNIENNDIKSIVIEDIKMKNIIVKCPKLEHFTATQNIIENITFEAPQLTIINLMHNKLTEFKGDFPNLLKLNLQKNSLTKVEITAPKLIELNIECNNNLKVLALNYNPDICKIVKDNNNNFNLIKNRILNIKDEDNMHTYDLDTFNGLKRVNLTPNFTDLTSIINNRNIPIHINKPLYNLTKWFPPQIPVKFTLIANVNNVYYDNKSLLKYEDNKLDSYEFPVKRGKCRCLCYDKLDIYLLSYTIENEKINFISTFKSSKPLKHH